jgi:hypothetical protein
MAELHTRNPKAVMSTKAYRSPRLLIIGTTAYPKANPYKQSASFEYECGKEHTHRVTDENDRYNSFAGKLLVAIKDIGESKTRAHRKGH